VACKEEHQVPVGVFRTWVKYIEKGEFPHTSRHFGVLRCNHCDSAPCIEICPTKALFRRPDGIVDFDNRRCIGCKACMQACPYDALYIDPNTDTAAKCNFCAHRVEANLEPACVIVCPTQAIIAGDLDNPASKASRIVATEKVSVRKPHKGTQPKLYYKGIEGDLLEPTRLSRQNTYVFADQHDSRARERAFDPALTREVYDVAHPAPWGWKIAAYLWTKSIAAGMMLVAAMFSAGEISGASEQWYSLLHILTPFVALIALAVTLALLVLDLKRPERFLYILIKPNFRSWLAIGGYILMAYGAMVVIWFLDGIYLKRMSGGLVLFTALLAIAAACYSAFLFAQAKGRDLWQSSMFFFHLLLQALVAGVATVSLMALTVRPYAMPQWGLGLSRFLFVVLIINLLAMLAELFLPHVSADARLAVRFLLRGRGSASFWLRVVIVGTVIPLCLIASMLVADIVQTPLVIVADVLALYGLWWFEILWVKAGQSVPLS
jgi:Fe-S-cluster-containing dehydrogenase component/formate-dependent nitrite reductase membrane component NrfD